MKLGILAALLLGALSAPSALLSQEPEEDPLDQRLREAIEATSEAKARRDAAYEAWKETGDTQAYLAAVAEYRETVTRQEPSQLDLWEARQQLIEYIYDSDDETVFDLYLVARARKAQRAKSREETEEIFSRIAENRAARESRGSALTPEN